MYKSESAETDHSEIETDAATGSFTDETTCWQDFLIDCVRVRPALYDKQHKNYKDTRGAKALLWAEICTLVKEAGYDTLGNKTTDTDSVQSKWEQIRDCFVKSVAKRNTALRDGKKILPSKYKHYDRMEWLLYVNPDKPPKVMQSSSTTSESQPCISQVSSTPHACESDRYPQHKKPRPSSELLGDEILKELQSTQNMVKSLISQRVTQMSNDELFGQMITSMIKDIPEGFEKDSMKLSIQSVILKTKHGKSLQCGSNVDENQ